MRKKNEDSKKLNAYSWTQQVNCIMVTLTQVHLILSSNEAYPAFNSEPQAKEVFTGEKKFQLVLEQPNPYGLIFR